MLPCMLMLLCVVSMVWYVDVALCWVYVKAGLWTVDWTMDWTVDCNMHNIGLAGSLLNKGKALGAGFMLIWCSC